MTDDDVRTMVKTDQGELPFQEYFVHRACEPAVRGFRFDGAEAARPAPGVLEALRQADLAIICPSNPWVSIDPILSVPGIRQAVTSKPTVAVSPLVGGKALKGPAEKMAAELGVETTPVSIARHYGEMLIGLIYDEADADASGALLELGVRSRRTRTVMRSERDRRRVAEELLAFGESLITVRSA